MWEITPLVSLESRVAFYFRKAKFVSRQHGFPTSQVNRRVAEGLLFSKKELTVSPLEVEKLGALYRQKEYL